MARRGAGRGTPTNEIDTTPVDGRAPREPSPAHLEVTLDLPGPPGRPIELTDSVHDLTRGRGTGTGRGEAPTSADEDRRRERSRLHDRAIAMRDLALLHHATHSTETTAALLDQLCSLVVGALGTDAAWVHLAGPQDPPTFRLVAGQGLDEEARRRRHALKPGVGPSGRALSTDMATSGREQFPRGGTLRRPAETVAMATPIRFGGQVIGVLSTHSSGTRRRFAPEESAILDAFALHAAFLVGNRASREADRLRLEDVSRQATLDALTGLPNRQVTLASLRELLAIGPVAVLHLDIDGMTLINELRGQEFGDAVLTTVADRLRTNAPPGATVGRIGPDEFVMLAPGHDDEAARSLAAGLSELVSRPIASQGTDPLNVSVTIGVASGTAAVDGPDADALLNAADLALIQARSRGRGAVEVFDRRLREDALRRAADQRQLLEAIETDRLVVHYQPVVDVATGRPSGVEALVRWDHPERGLIPPDEFIPLAEEIGCIDRIDALVLEAACAELARWRSLDPRLCDLRMSVNTSAGRFAAPGFAEDVTAILERHGLPARRLAIEITESTVMEHSGVVEHTLAELVGLGVRLMVDDFGTGYSSLRYLKRYPLGVLKIDRGFVSGLGASNEDDAIVGAIVGMARSLGLEVIAEGVEHEEQCGLLDALGCDMAQGYLFSRPVPGAELVARFLDPQDPISLTRALPGCH